MGATSAGLMAAMFSLSLLATPQPRPLTFNQGHSQQPPARRRRKFKGWQREARRR